MDILTRSTILIVAATITSSCTSDTDRLDPAAIEAGVMEWRSGRLERLTAPNGFLTLVGLFIVNPNDSRVLILFGTYKGTVKKYGFYWANPFLVKKKITLRARNLNGDKIKVNDKAGNPIEIAAVVVWQVEDTFKASFDVDDYEH